MVKTASMRCSVTFRQSSGCRGTILCGSCGCCSMRCSRSSRRALRGCAHGWAVPSIPPEKLLRALLLQVLYTVRSERLLMEQLDYNLPFRWFVGLNMDDAIWDATVHSKNRERLLQAEVAEVFFKEVVRIAKQHGLLSDEHFTVDGTLIEAWAGQKSFKKKGETSSPPDDPGNPTVNFHGERSGTVVGNGSPGCLLGQQRLIIWCAFAT